MTEPTTAAGRELKDTMRLWFFDLDGNLDDEAFDHWWPLIVEAEAEARQQDGSALLSIAEEHDERARHGGCSDLAPKMLAALAALPPSTPPALDVAEVLRLLRLVERDYDDGLTEPESEDMIRDVRALLTRLEQER